MALFYIKRIYNVKVIEPKRWIKYTKMQTIQFFFKNLKSKLTQIFIFLMKVIFKILYNIKKYIKFEITWV